MYTSESNKAFSQRVGNSILRIGEEQRIDVIVAGEDFPLHSTIQEATADREDSITRGVFDSVREQMEVSKLHHLLVKFDDLLVDKGGNILLVVRKIPEEVVKARGKLEQVYLENGLEPKPIKNLFHSTVGRIVNLNDASAKQQEMLYRLKGLRSSIRKDPLELEVARIYTRTSWNIIDELKKTS